MQRKLKSLQNDCNESIIKEKGVEKDERKQAFRIQRKYKFQYFYENDQCICKLWNRKDHIWNYR